MTERRHWLGIFKPATRRKAIPKIAIFGPSGAGKTYSALAVASGMMEQAEKDGKPSRIAFADTERGSATLYAGIHREFDHVDIDPPYKTEQISKIIKAAVEGGYGCLVIDSLSPFWEGTGGLLEVQDNLAKKTRNSYTAWKEVTPMYQDMVEAIISAPIPVIVCLRAKQDYEISQESGSAKVKKLGTKPIMRDGFEYETHVAFDVTHDGHIASASKDRTSLFAKKCAPLTAEDGRILYEWYNAGVEPDMADLLMEDIKARISGVTDAGELRQIYSEFADSINIRPDKDKLISLFKAQAA